MVRRHGGLGGAAGVSVLGGGARGDEIHARMRERAGNTAARSVRRSVGVAWRAGTAVWVGPGGLLTRGMDKR